MTLAEAYPELIKEWHLTKNGNLTPYDVTQASQLKVWWQCLVSKDHEWEARIGNRAYNQSGCPFCIGSGGRKVCLSNCLFTTHPHIAARWHPTKNGELTPFMFTFGADKKMWWQCPVASDHEWETEICNMTNQNIKCPCCAGKKIVLSTCLATTHPDLAKEWHATKNILSPFDVTWGSGKKVWWQCQVAPDHEYETKICYRTGCDSGCPCCCGLKIVKSNCLRTLYPLVAAEWHPTKNGIRTPDVVGSSNNNGRIWWAGPCGHEWQATIWTRIDGHGCPVCGFSKGENMIKNYFDKNSISYECQKIFASCRSQKVLPFDFMIDGDQIKLIEFQGEQHYRFVKFFHENKAGFVDLKKRDKIKKNWCQQNNIPLLIIPYWENNVEKVLDDFVKS